MLWGWPFLTWELVVKGSLWVAGVAGTIAAIAAFIAGYVGYELTDAIQTAADERVAEAGREADVAQLAAAKANENAATANERTAVLEKEGAQLREAAAWRSITLAKYNSLKNALAGQHFEVWTSWVGADPEATKYRMEIDEALTDAGLKTKYFSGWERAVGLQITNVPGQEHNTLIAAFSAARISFVSVPPMTQMMAGQLAIIVGSKPPPF